MVPFLSARRFILSSSWFCKRRPLASPTWYPDLQGLRIKFPVAHTGGNFHLWPDRRDCADDFAALVNGDAVAALQGRVRSAHPRHPAPGLTREMRKPSTFLVFRVAKV